MRRASAVAVFSGFFLIACGSGAPATVAPPVGEPVVTAPPARAEARAQLVIDGEAWCVVDGAGLRCGSKSAADTGSPFAAAQPGIVRAALSRGAVCGVDAAGAARCWGRDGGPSQAPAGVFADVGGATRYQCFAGASLACIGEVPSFAAHSGELIRVAVDGDRLCGLQPSGEIVCHGEGQAPSGTFVDLDVDVAGVCGVRSDGTASCEVDVEGGPEGVVLDVAVGVSDVCWLTPEGIARCTGSGSPPAGAFLAIATHGSRACAVGSGDPVCWELPDDEGGPEDGPGDGG